MSAIDVIESAEEHWYEVRWHAVVEYKENKYVICVQETSKWGDNSLYHYDDTKRYGIGDSVNDSEIHDAIIGRLENSGLLSQDELMEGSAFFDDEDEDDETPAFNVPEFSKPTTEIPVFEYVPKKSE